MRAQRGVEVEHFAAEPAPDDASTMARLLAQARGTHVAFVGPGDELHPGALARAARAFDAPASGVDVVYSDEDLIDARGRRSRPFHKPAWSPDRARCQAYTGRLAVYRRGAVEAAGRLRPDLGSATEHDLVLRMSERAGAVVRHVPEVLYHRRVADGGRVDAPWIEPLGSAGIDAVNEHLGRTHVPAHAVGYPGRDDLAQLEPRLRTHPLVSIVIPTAAAIRAEHGPDPLVLRCVESVVARSTYRDFEILCVVDKRVDPRTRARLEVIAGGRLRFVEPRTDHFSFSRSINAGALAASGTVLLLLNDDTAVITPDWLERMLVYALAEPVGAVGAKLRFGDGRLQHVGVVGVRGNPGHAYYGAPANSVGYADNVLVPSNYLAVTAACLMTRREAFEKVGGLSAAFPLNYNDVDYCLKLRDAGYRSVYVPDAELYHYESVSRSGAVAIEELDRLRARWGRCLYNDPFYGPHFGSGIADFVPDGQGEPVTTISSHADGAESTTS